MIEILLGTYNGEKYIKSQIDSILAQDYQEFVITVRDDGSTDDTVKIIRDYCDRYPEKITLIEDDLRGGSAKANFTILLQNAGKDYVMFCDQDDVWHKNKVRATLAKMKQMEKKYGIDTPILVHSDLRVVDEKLDIINESFFDFMNLPYRKNLSNLIIQNSIVGCTAMLNKKLLAMSKKIKDSDSILMHDHAVGIIAGAYGKIGVIKEATIDYRQHSDNSVGASDANSLGYKLKRLMRGKKKFREDMLLSFAQTEYILKIMSDEPLCEQTREMLSGYADLKNKSKLQKIKFYKKYGIYKKGTARKIMQNIWA